MMIMMTTTKPMTTQTTIMMAKILKMTTIRRRICMETGIMGKRRAFDLPLV